MKLRTLVKIAVTSSVVLLCAGFASYSFFRLSAAEDRKDFNLYTLVPLSASAVLATDDAAELVIEIDELACSKKQQYLHISRLFTDLKQYLYTIVEDTPHGLSRQMNQVLISFHEPDNDRNQVLYCSLALDDGELIEKVVQKYTSSDYPSRVFNYKGEQIDIYPMADGNFLSCYLTRDFMVISYQKKLIEEVIDAQKSGESLASDSTFLEIRSPQKSAAIATIYTRIEGMIGWTEFDMKLKDNFIYFSGISHDVDTCLAFINVLHQQKTVKGFPGEALPSTAFYFSRHGTVDWSSMLSLSGAQEYSEMVETGEVREWNEKLSRYLIENAGRDLVTCLFQREDTLSLPATVMSLPVANVTEAERLLRSIAETAPVEVGLKKKSRITFYYASGKAYPIYMLPQTTLFAQLTHFVDVPSHLYATFYGGRLLLAPDADCLSGYIRQLEAGEVLGGALAYQAGMDGLSDTYHFILMADFDQVFRQPESSARLVPDFFFRNSEFFRNFMLFAQFTCTDGVIYPNIVLQYKSE